MLVLPDKESIRYQIELMRAPCKLSQLEQNVIEAIYSTAKEIDIDKAVQAWLDLEFPSFEHFKYHRPKIEFSEFLKEREEKQMECPKCGAKLKPEGKGWVCPGCKQDYPHGLALYDE